MTFALQICEHLQFNATWALMAVHTIAMTTLWRQENVLETMGIVYLFHFYAFLMLCLTAGWLEVGSTALTDILAILMASVYTASKAFNST